MSAENYPWPDDDEENHDISSGLVAYYPKLDNPVYKGLVGDVQVHDQALMPDVICLLYAT